MLLTVRAERNAALETPSDLGHLLHKHPGRVQTFEVYGGAAHVFYPELDEERCTVALMLEIDPASLASGRSGRRDDFVLGHYVNDRPYVASSLLSAAIAKVFGSALHGRCTGHEALAESRLNLTIGLPVVAGDTELVRRLFEPMGWAVRAEPITLDPTRPDWGDAPMVSLTLAGSFRLADALGHLYVLLPVLDDAKHYWVADDEVDKLVRAGAGWLARHPERDVVTRRYLAHQRDLQDAAVARLAELDDHPPERDGDDEGMAVGRSLVRSRHEAVLDVVRELRATSVLDLGCGDGALLGALLELRGVEMVVGTDVSDAALSRAAKRLHVDAMTERQAQRLTLLVSSLLYKDDRLEGYDLAILMEVIEHIEPGRLPAVVANVFGAMCPRAVVVTTPNVEYNVRYTGLATGGRRHPDHRFEWTRDEFTQWAGEVGGAHGYSVRFRDVGEPDSAVGPPTQMAVFSLQQRAGESS